MKQAVPLLRFPTDPAEGAALAADTRLLDHGAGRATRGRGAQPQIRAVGQ